MRKVVFALFAFGAVLAVPAALSAQVNVGPYLAFHDDADLGIGAFVGVPMASIHEDLSFVGDFGFFFPGGGSHGGVDVDVDYWELNANGLFKFPLEGQAFTPWALAGLNIANGSAGVDLGELGSASASDTEIGLNVGGGVTFGEGPMSPFVGAKFELGGGEGAVIFGGLSFVVGG